MAAIATGDARDAVARFVRETGATYPVYLDDGRAAESFAIAGTPTCIVVESDGRVSYRGTHPPEHLR